MIASSTASSSARVRRPRFTGLAPLSLLADPGSTTAGQAAGVIGKSKPAAHRYLSALRASGIARLDGSGRGARFRLVDEPPGPWPPLTVLPGGDGQDDDEDTTEAGDRQ
jgi:DNA-binding transcriptional ArsR family regulator